MANRSMEPSPQQLAAADRVHKALLHEMNLAGMEGASVEAVLSGAGLAIADVITAKAGSERVAPWFEGQAALVRRLQSGGA